MMLLLLRLGLWSIPSPPLLEFGVYKTYTPSGLLTNLIKDLEHFFLLASISETLTSNRQ